MGAERVVVLVYRLPRQSGDQATSQKDGHQKKTHFHIVFEFDFDFGLELEFDKFSLTLAQRWRPRRAVCLVSFTILGRAEAPAIQ